MGAAVCGFYGGLAMVTGAVAGVFLTGAHLGIAGSRCWRILPTLALSTHLLGSFLHYLLMGQPVDGGKVRSRLSRASEGNSPSTQPLVGRKFGVGSAARRKKVRRRLSRSMEESSLSTQPLSGRKFCVGSAARRQEVRRQLNHSAER
jgi:hypothetical protein